MTAARSHFWQRLIAIEMQAREARMTPSPRLRGEGGGEGSATTQRSAAPLTLALSSQAGRGDQTGSGASP